MLRVSAVGEEGMRNTKCNQTLFDEVWWAFSMVGFKSLLRQVTVHCSVLSLLIKIIRKWHTKEKSWKSHWANKNRKRLHDFTRFEFAQFYSFGMNVPGNLCLEIGVSTRNTPRPLGNAQSWSKSFYWNLWVSLKYRVRSRCRNLNPTSDFLVATDTSCCLTVA